MKKETININPFYHGKLEHQNKPTIYIPDYILEWFYTKSILFEGTKGSGKSSMLTALSWQVLWNIGDRNIYASKKVRKYFKEKRCIGVYHRITTSNLEQWERWHVPEEIKQRYFATYIEFLYLDLLIDAVINIRRNNKELFRDIPAEEVFVEELLQECFPANNRPTIFEKSFMSLHRFISDVYRGILHSVNFDRKDMNLENAHVMVGAGQIVKLFGELFKKLYHQYDWGIHIIMDDCNFLSEWQTKVINTAIVNCSNPVSYKISSISGLYPTKNTLNPDRTLGKDYIDEISLDIEDRKKKIDFLDGVCQSRICSLYGDEKAKKFDIRKLLGKFNLEEALYSKLKKSESSNVDKFVEEIDRDNLTTKKISVTSYWLEKKKVRKITNDTSCKCDRKAKRRKDNMYLRKFNHAAAFAICIKYNLGFPYSGYNTIIHLSGGSVRDFLLIMHQLYETKGLGRLLESKTIGLGDQSKATRDAAEEKFKIIEEETARQKKNITLGIICNRLGHFFKECQTEKYIHIAPEPGSLSFDKKILSEETKEVIRVGLTSGCLMVKKKDNRIMISLHRILTPKYNINFRSPFTYYISVTEKKQLDDFFLEDESEYTRAAQEILLKRAGKYLRRKKVRKGKNTTTTSLNDWLASQSNKLEGSN
jgi:hypothetical protein